MIKTPVYVKIYSLSVKINPFVCIVCFPSCSIKLFYKSYCSVDTKPVKKNQKSHPFVCKRVKRSPSAAVEPVNLIVMTLKRSYIYRAFF